MRSRWDRSERRDIRKGARRDRPDWSSRYWYGCLYGRDPNPGKTPFLPPFSSTLVLFTGEIWVELDNAVGEEFLLVGIFGYPTKFSV